MSEPGITVVEQMRADWNARAQEDANYYVAFGRREQDDEEFEATGAEVVHGLEWEMRRLGRIRDKRKLRALEIGCGPGRLMRPMAAHFGEIHGVDISDQMVERARRRLAGAPHAHAHVARNSNLDMFASESFDFVYSYAVFQHIPSREVVLGYLREAFRVLKPGALIRCQLNGLPETAARYDTWSGVRIQADEFKDFCRNTGFQMYSLEGAQTQYMWTTLRKQSPNWHSRLSYPTQHAAIRRITNAQNSEPVAPSAGRFAALSLWVDRLPDEGDILNLRVRIGRQDASIVYIGPREHDGMTQINVRVPEGTETGLQPAQICWEGEPISEESKIRIVPQPPIVPRVVSLSDGINLMSGPRIENRSVKMTIEELHDPARFAAWISGTPASNADIFCTDPIPPRHEVNFDLPSSITPGQHQLQVQLGRRLLPPIVIEVVA